MSFVRYLNDHKRNTAKHEEKLEKKRMYVSWTKYKLKLNKGVIEQRKKVEIEYYMKCESSHYDTALLPRGQCTVLHHYRRSVLKSL